MDTTTISLRRDFFTDKERTLVDFDGLKAVLFSYDSGVHGVRLTNEHGYIVVLPFKGQQIWNAFFHGRYLNMKTMYQEPKNTDHFLNTYGCFVMHCGPLRMGCPGPEDDHTLHGELPYADYDEAAIVVGNDEQGKYIGVTGTYDYNRAFADKYQARPVVRLHQGSALIDVSMTIENRSNYPMELMYMCHVNFRPVNQGRIVQSVAWTKDSMELRTAIPEHVKVSEEFVDFLRQLEKNPRLTEVIRPGDEYNPEIAFFIHRPMVDEDGWSHYMQVHPDQSADYIRYKPEELDHNTRWISRTDDQAGLGLALPATCEPEGYTAEKKKGTIKESPARSSVAFSVVAGYLEKGPAKEMEVFIGELLK
ncbi:MAG: DUF4432 family protein [Ardenticatenia bacterium]|nr:DUF4432 family protein [Ardenticatenia bacterium]